MGFFSLSWEHARGEPRVLSCPMPLTWKVYSPEVPGFRTQIFSLGVKGDSWFRENSSLFPLSQGSRSRDSAADQKVALRCIKVGVKATACT